MRSNGNVQVVNAKQYLVQMRRLRISTTGRDATLHLGNKSHIVAFGLFSFRECCVVDLNREVGVHAKVMGRLATACPIVWSEAGWLILNR